MSRELQRDPHGSRRGQVKYQKWRSIRKQGWGDMGKTALGLAGRLALL